EALRQRGGDIGDGIVELLTAGAVTGQMRGDQVPAAPPPPAIAATGDRTLTGGPGRGLLDIHDGTVAARAVGCRCPPRCPGRSEERRVGKEGRCRWWPGDGKKDNENERGSDVDGVGRGGSEGE